MITASHSLQASMPASEAPVWAPVAVFVYNRVEHAKQTLDALAANLGAQQSEVVVFSDGPKEGDEQSAAQVEAVRALLAQPAYKQFASYSVVAAEQNQGLAQSIIGGVSQLLERHPSVIVLEDDLVTAPGFLAYMNAALVRYQAEPAVFSVSGYSFGRNKLKASASLAEDAYFSYRNSSWGWATWREAWLQADWVLPNLSEELADKRHRRAFNRGGSDMCAMIEAWQQGKNNSWAIRWSYAHFKHNALSLTPCDSFVKNIGHDGSGENCAANSFYDTELSRQQGEFCLPELVYMNPRIAAQFRWQFSLLVRLKKRLMKYFNY